MLVRFQPRLPNEKKMKFKDLKNCPQEYKLIKQETIIHQTWERKCGCAKRFYVYEDGSKKLMTKKGCVFHRFGMNPHCIK